jgi:aromatic-amino-acid transaminase
MPPDHGAAIVRMILQNPEERAVWQDELTEMRERITLMRKILASELKSIDKRYAYIEQQRGMFSLLSLGVESIHALRQKHGIYMADNGRVNLSGLNEESAMRFVEAIKSVMNRL